MTDGQMQKGIKLGVVLAHLAVEYWKLLRSFDNAMATAPPDAKVRLAAQARYAAGRLEALLSEANMRLLDFDGVRFEVNLPAVAINGEDVSGLEDVIIERTIEPAILAGMSVVLMAKVFLAPAGERKGEKYVPGH
jgi:hypothetical protein